MLTIADRWRLSLPDPWLVPLDLPWDWDPCLRPCKSSSTPSPPNPSLTTWPPPPQSPSPPNPSLTSWPAALSSPSSPISNYKKMNQTLFWDLYISRSKCFSSWWSWPSWCLRLSLQNTRCPPSHYLLFSLSFCVCLSFLSVFVFVFVFLSVFVFVVTAAKYSAYTWSTSPMNSGGLPRVLDHASWILRLHIPWVNRLFLFPHSSSSASSSCPCWYLCPSTSSSSYPCWYPCPSTSSSLSLLSSSSSCSCWYIQSFCRDHPHHVGDISLSGAHLWNERRRWGTQRLLEVTDPFCFLSTSHFHTGRN